MLVSTFKISNKRLVSLGLGEEQLQDSSKPASPVNARLQIIAFGQPDAVEPKPAARRRRQKGRRTGQEEALIIRRMGKTLKARHQ